MELRKELRSTMIKTNARFRGPTSSLDYTNMVNEATHDMILLRKTFTGAEEGQSEQIKQNLGNYVNGGEESVYANIPTSSVMYAEKGGLLKGGVPLAKLNTWTSFGACRVTDIEGGHQLYSDGSMAPSGIYVEIDVEPGDVFMMQFGIKKVSGMDEKNTVKFGSTNVNKVGNFYEYSLPLDGSIGYIDHVIECLYRETIRLEITLLHDGFALNGGTVDFLQPRIDKMHKKEVSLTPTNFGIKDKINNIAREIENLSR